MLEGAQAAAGWCHSQLPHSCPLVFRGGQRATNVKQQHPIDVTAAFCSLLLPSATCTTGQTGAAWRPLCCAAFAVHSAMMGFTWLHCDDCAAGSEQQYAQPETW